MKQSTVILYSFILFSACQEEFTPDIKQSENALVVEGFITTQPGIQIVKLTKSKAFTERPYYIGVTGAYVYVLDDLGNRFQYFESNSKGTYQTNPEDKIAAQLGRTYTLVIETATGDIYQSLPQTINLCAKIKDAYIEPSREIILTEDAYGAPQEITIAGIFIKADTQGNLPRQNYYLYTWKAYEQHHTVIYTIFDNFEIYQHKQLGGNYTFVIKTGNADESTDRILLQNKLVFIPKELLLDYEAQIPVGYDIFRKYFEGLLFKLELRSLSADAYSFFKECEEQLEASGKLFDPLTSQLTGNINCISDSTKRVFGVFYASDVTIRYNYFYFNYADRTYSTEIDSFPELWLDTCKWYSPPDGWIRPPF